MFWNVLGMLDILVLGMVCVWNVLDILGLWVGGRGVGLFFDRIGDLGHFWSPGRACFWNDVGHFGPQECLFFAECVGDFGHFGSPERVCVLECVGDVGIWGLRRVFF